MRCEDFELRLNQLLDLGDQIEDLSWDPELHQHSRTCPTCRALHRGYCAMQAGFLLLASEQWKSTVAPDKPEELAAQQLAAPAPSSEATGPRIPTRSLRLFAFAASAAAVAALAYMMLASARFLPLPNSMERLIDVATQRFEGPQPVDAPRPLPEETVPGEAAIRSFVSRVPSIASDVLYRAVPIEETTSEPLRRMVSYLFEAPPIEDTFNGVLPSTWSGAEANDTDSHDENSLLPAVDGTRS